MCTCLAGTSLICRAGTKHQLVPLGLHCALVVEQEIQTFSMHLIASPASCNPNLPLHLWDHILHRVDLTLTIPRASQINTRLSAKAYLNGAFEFSWTPPVPPGTKVLFFGGPINRLIFVQNGSEVLYIGPAMEHYC